MQTVHTKEGKCLPWAGYFAPDDVTPVDDYGQPVFPGIRTCGHLDCCSPAHIIRYED